MNDEKIQKENETFIRLHRKIMETSWYKNLTTAHLAIHCLLRANWQPAKIIHDKQEIQLQRGEFVSGRKALAEETGLSEQEIRTSLTILKNTHFLTIKSTNKFSVFSIAKYNYYQTKSTSKSTNQQPASNQQVTTDKEGNELKELKETTLPSPNPKADIWTFQIPTTEELLKLQPHVQVVWHYIQLMGYTYDSKDAYQADFKRWCASAATLLKYEKGDIAAVKDCIETLQYDAGKKNYEWKLETVVKKYTEIKNAKEV